MDTQCLFCILLRSLLACAGCSNDDVEYEATDEAEGGASSGTEEGTESGAESGTEGGTESGTEGGTESGTEDGIEPDLPADVIVDPMPVHLPTPGQWPAAAFSGSQYLVVWDDKRARRRILYGGRVAADGSVLDPFGFPILDFPGAESPLWYFLFPAVVSDGADFLVVAQVAGQLFGVRVSAAGKVLDPEGIPIAMLANSMSPPSLAFDGEQYRVAWSHDTGIHSARVKPDGTLLDPGGVLVHPMDVGAKSVGMSFDGTHHLLSWKEDDAQLQTSVLNGARIAPDGTLIDETPILIHPIDSSVWDFLGPVAGFDGTNHVIAWVEMGVDAEGDEQYQVLASRVTPEGTSLDPDGIMAFTTGFETSQVHRLDIAAASSRSDVVWSEDYGGEGGPTAAFVQAVQIATDGTTSKHPATAFTRGLEATLARDPDGALLLWRDGDDQSADYPAIVGTRLDAAGTPVVGGEVAPASPASRQEVKAVASDGHDFFVLWTDTRDPKGEGDGKVLYGALVGADGSPLGPEPMQFDDHCANLVEAVFDGANYVVTWVRFTGGEGDGSPFHTVRVSPAGERLDIEPLSPPLWSPSITLAGASDGTHTLWVGQDYDSELAAVLLDQQGSVTGDVIPIVDEGSAGYPDEPVVAFDGIGYLVVWDNHWDGVSGQRITQAGALEGPLFSIAGEDSIHDVAIAAGGGNHLVVWEDDIGIWAARVSSGGQVLDPGGQLVVALESSECDDWEPELRNGTCSSVIFDGDDFIVAWRAPSIPGDWNSIDLYGAKVSPEGEVLAPFPISQELEREGPPLLARGDGGVRAAYARFVPGPPYDTRRAVTRLVP